MTNRSKVTIIKVKACITLSTTNYAAKRQKSQPHAIILTAYRMAENQFCEGGTIGTGAPAGVSAAIGVSRNLACTGD
jgi:hypothetical protein